MTHALTVLWTVLAVGVQAALALVVLLFAASRFADGARRALDALRRLVAGRELWLAWLLAAASTFGSLYYSEIANYPPCELCWFQRIAMYPLALVLFLGAVARDQRGAYYALGLPGMGVLLSLYHIYVERNPDSAPSCTIGVPCTTRWIWELGYISIPVLAGTAFAGIIVLLLFRLRPLGAGAP